jgi:hypothetical protein
MLKVYDMLGREVATLVHQDMGPGSHERMFDAKNLASGMYMYRLRSGGLTQTKMMLLTK